MNWNLINRRTHLYLGMFLVPWVLVYGISSLVISHNRAIGATYQDDGVPEWKKRFERPHDRSVPEDADLQVVARELQEDAGIDGSFYARWAGKNRVIVDTFTFWTFQRIIYNTETAVLEVHDRRFRLDHFFIWMHERHGYGRGAFLNDVWAIVLDVVCLAFLTWIATGLIMWWQLSRHRRWGALALATGFGSFLLLL